MDDEQRRRALADFLRTRRARLSPAQVDLPDGVRRRTPGLRREEVAQLADVSVAYYTWLEQARDLRVSKGVLESIAAALRLTADERTHLFLLADQAPSPDAPVAVEEGVGGTLQRVLDAQGASPAYILGAHCDVLAWNAVACVVFGDFAALPPEGRNFVRFVFTDDDFRRRVVDWDGFAREVVAVFRGISGRQGGDPWFARFAADLGRDSPEFRRWWPRHDVRGPSDATREIDHPRVGRLTLEPASFQVIGHVDMRLCLYLPADADTVARLRRLAAAQARHAISGPPGARE